MECALCKAKYVAKTEAAFKIELKNHREDVSNPNSFPADLHFRKPAHYISEKLGSHSTCIQNLH